MNRLYSVTLRGLATVLALAATNLCAASGQTEPIVDVRFDGPYQEVKSSLGDQWAPTWGPDDVMYTANDDGASFGGMHKNAIAFGELTGSDPDKLKGTTVNGMSDYREPPEFGPENAQWKVLDSYELAGQRYRFLPCTGSGNVIASCLGTSADSGKTWRVLADRRSPVFPDAKLHEVSFIVYRKEYEAMMAGEGGRYIYAASYYGVADGYDSYIIGRVSREKLSSGNPADWMFSQGGGTWSNSFKTASPELNVIGVGPDGANWKAMNTYSIDGVLYAFVTRCYYPWLSRDPRHRHVFRDSSVIMSLDRGRTWTRPARENYRAPMFPGMRFGAPYFVWYGKDGEAGVDNADNYVYAVSNNGHFEAGDDYILGRVPKAKLSRLSASDWSFYKAGDGMREESWTASLQQASPILINPGRSSMTGMTYIPGLRRYVMVVWRYKQVSFGSGILNSDLSTTLEFFNAPKPWGPWVRIKSFETGQLGWYTPVIGQRFQTITEDASTARVILYASGLRSRPEGSVDYSLYKLNSMALTLSTKPLSDTDPSFVGER